MGPDALGTIFTRCFFIQLFETGFYAMALWSLGARGVPWLDVLSYTGYKYVALCVNSIAYLVGGDRPYLLALHGAVFLILHAQDRRADRADGTGEHESSARGRGAGHGPDAVRVDLGAGQG